MRWSLIFSGLQSTGWLLSVLFCVVAAFALSALLMRYERRLVSRTVGWMLLAIRSAILLWLLLILMQPVLTHEWDVAESGRVVVAIDVSGSMETADRHAATEEKISWARALGMLDSSMTDEDIRQLAAAVDGRLPAAADDNAETEQPQRPVSATRLKQTREVIDEFNRMPRREFVTRLLTNRAGKLLDKLSESAAVELRLFATDQQAIHESQLATVEESLLKSTGPTATDAVGLINALTADQEANRTRGLILFSDGRQTEPGDLSVEGRRLGNLQVPVYAVPIGSRLKPRDISVASIEAPEAVFLNDAAMLNVVLGTSGFEGTPITIQLERDGQPVDSQTITPAADSARLSFTAPTDQTGRFDYRVSVAEHAGELRLDNNERTFSFQVVDNKGRVLLVDGDARWELRYLKNLLERDKQVDLNTVVFRQPYLQLLNANFIDRDLPPEETFREQLANTDLLVVGDVDFSQFSEASWKLVQDAVSRDGLTLVLIPGRRSMSEYQRVQPLRELIPLEEPVGRLAEHFLNSAGDGTQSVFQLQEAPAADDLPMFQFADASNPAASLSTLPGHPWICTGQTKPSATVWAWALNPANQAEREVAIAHQYFGFGQVVWLGLDSTWRWRQRRGDSMHHKFWGQLVRWAARNRTAAGNDQVRMTLSDVVAEESESVQVVARFNPRAAAGIGDGPVEAVVAPVEPAANEATATPKRIQLKPLADSPERFSGRIPPLSPGVWKVTLEVAGQADADSPVTSELVVQPGKSPELADVSCHREALHQLSSLSGGELIEPWDISRLPELIKPEEFQEAQISERPLWDHWTSLIVFFALLMTEWVTRKLNGLP